MGFNDVTRYQVTRRNARQIKRRVLTVNVCDDDDDDDATVQRVGFRKLSPPSIQQLQASVTELRLLAWREMHSKTGILQGERLMVVLDITGIALPRVFASTLFQPPFTPRLAVRGPFSPFSGIPNTRLRAVSPLYLWPLCARRRVACCEN